MPLCSCRVFARSSQRASLTRLAELGPVLSGSDPGSFNGQSTVLTAVVNAALRPKSHTATSATYTLPARAFTLKVGNGRYVTTRASTLEYTFPATNPDQMVITGTFSIGGVDFPMVVTVSLANGSFTTSVKTHPQKIAPTPQTLTPAKTASGAGSKLKYTILGNSTTLGISGTASN